MGTWGVIYIYIYKSPEAIHQEAKKSCAVLKKEATEAASMQMSGFYSRCLSFAVQVFGAVEASGLGFGAVP